VLNFIPTEELIIETFVIVMLYIESVTFSINIPMFSIASITLPFPSMITLATEMLIQYVPKEVIKETNKYQKIS
jgi:hypothetical protein